ncbi:MAG: tetratricopeptide repeat protein [Acidobacteria bacterium]|nr:tetratricopeptide repeat protein [Acidobacteriota bacterium]
MRRCLPLLVVLAVSVGVAADATAQSTPGSRVLVMPFTAEVEPGAPGGGGAALWLGEAASSLIVEGLATRGVGAMSRDERVTAFERLNLPMTSALTRATTIRVGELIGASEVVFGEVRLGERLEIRARLVRLSTGNELAAVEHQGALPDIFQVFDVVSERIAGQTGRFRPARPAPPPLALETFESYLKGLVAVTPAAQQRFLETAVRQAPHDPRILMALWDVYTVQGDHERALASANAVTPDAGAYRQARFAVALSMLELRRFDGAWQALTTIYNSERAAAVSSLLGVVQLRRGTPPAGNTPATYFRRAVDEHPEHTDYIFNLGYAHALAGNAAEALTWLREVVRFDAADGDAHRVMSALLAAAGRTTEAQRELELARLLGGTADEAATFVLSPQVPQGLERIPAVADLSSAAVLRTVVGAPAQRDQEATARFHLTNARTLLGEGRDREAISELRRAIYLSPYEEEPHRLLGGVHQRAGRLAEAVEAFTVALWCRETAEGRVALGAALLESGQREAAQREAARALVLDPGSAEARALGDRARP